MEWTREAVDGLLRRDADRWLRLAEEVRLLARSAGKRSRLKPAEADVVRGRAILLLLQRDMRRLRAIRAPARFAAYLRRMVAHLAGEVARRPAHARERLATDLRAKEPVRWLESFPSPETRSGPAPRHVSGGVAQLLLTSRNLLTGLEFRVLWMGYVEGTSLHGIARALGRSRPGVRQARDRGVAALRRRFRRRPV
ncbi:MAG: hypothetical protein ACREID_08590 [Planctomycetota bacterium]